MDKNNDGIADKDVVSRLVSSRNVKTVTTDKRSMRRQATSLPAPLSSSTDDLNIGPGAVDNAVETLTSSTMTSDDGLDVHAAVSDFQSIGRNIDIGISANIVPAGEDGMASPPFVDDAARSLMRALEDSQPFGGFTVVDLRSYCHVYGSLVVQQILSVVEQLFDASLTESGVLVTANSVVNHKPHIEWKDDAGSTSVVSNILRCKCSPL